MANYLIQDTSVTNIADSIRAMSETNASLTMTPEEMAKYILNVKGNYTNLVATSTSDGTTVYNTTGYKDSAYWAMGNAGVTIDSAGYVSTGNIYLPTDINCIFVKGCSWDGTSTARMICSGTPGGLSWVFYSNSSSSPSKLEQFFDVKTIGTNHYQFKLTDDGKTYLSGKYYRFTLKGVGADLTITHDQLIW